jgi:hypothetical protein
VSLSQDAATDFDPLGDDEEHADEKSFLVDGDRNTTWSTESYTGSVLSDKEGVGIYVDAGTDDGGGIRARRLTVRSTTPGFSAEVYAANGGPPDALDGWTRLSSGKVFDKRTGVPLEGDREFRYYLLWITGLPTDEEKVELSEVELFQMGRG